MTESGVLEKNYVRVGKQGVPRLILVSKDLLQEAQNKLEKKRKKELAAAAELAGGQELTEGQELPKVSLASLAKRQLRHMSSGPFLPDEEEFRPMHMTFCDVKAVLKFDGKNFFIDPHYEDKKKRPS